MAKSKKLSVNNAYLDAALNTERISLPVSTDALNKALAELAAKLKTIGAPDTPNYARRTKKLLQAFRHRLFGAAVVDSFGHELKQGDFFLLVTKSGETNPDWDFDYYAIAGKQPVVSSLYPMSEKITNVFQLNGDHRDTYLAMEVAVYYEESGNPCVLRPVNRLNLVSLECLAVNAVKIFPPIVR